MHRWDVETVLGQHVPIPPDLAVREVENVFANFAPRLAGSGVADIGGTVWLRTTDTPSAWSAHVDNGRLLTEQAPADPATPSPWLARRRTSRCWYGSARCRPGPDWR